MDHGSDIRDRLHNLATLAPTGAGVQDGGELIEMVRLQRRRRAGWVAVAAAIAVVVVGVATLLPRTMATDPADTAAPTSSADAGGRGLYDLAPRGSLAGDDTLILQAMAASWDDGTADSGTPPVDPANDTRRVSFIGEVPGGQAWALVQGMVGGQTYFIWFADVDTADGIIWQRAWGPDRSFPDTPIALLDDAGDRGPLVVVTTPGDRVEFSSTGTGDEAGAPGYQPVDTTDGIAVAEVPSPRYPSFSLGFRVIRDDSVAYEQPPQVFDSTQPLGPQPTYVPPADAPPAAEFGQRMADCLRPLGFEVTVIGDGLQFQTTPENEQAYHAATDTCYEQTGYR